MDRPLRIAVADDEPDIRDYFRRMLPRLGHEVVAVAGDGRELVEQCRAACPDLVITDVCMPELDGAEAAEAVCRERPTPFILLSAYFGRSRPRCAEGEHFVGRLGKPIRQADLLALLGLARERCRGREAPSRAVLP